MYNREDLEANPGILSELKSHLVIYQGGGFDGCFWQWNWGFIREDGTWDSIHASGRRGCPTMEKLVQYIMDAPTFGDIQIIPVSELAEHFVGKYNDGIVLNAMRHLASEHGIHVEAECQECHQTFDVAQMHNYSYHGEGGMAVALDGIVCDDCLEIINRGWDFTYRDEDGDLVDEWREERYIREKLPKLWKVLAPLLQEDLSEDEVVTFRGRKFEWGKLKSCKFTTSSDI
jgi:hypothetical protein